MAFSSVEGSPPRSTPAPPGGHEGPPTSPHGCTSTARVGPSTNPQLSQHRCPPHGGDPGCPQCLRCPQGVGGHSVKTWHHSAKLLNPPRCPGPLSSEQKTLKPSRTLHPGTLEQVKVVEATGTLTVAIKGRTPGCHFPLTRHPPARPGTALRRLPSAGPSGRTQATSAPCHHPSRPGTQRPPSRWPRPWRGR